MSAYFKARCASGHVYLVPADHTQEQSECPECRRADRILGVWDSADRLEYAAASDALVSYVLRSWRRGEFPSLESALITMVCGLVKDRKNSVERQIAKDIRGPSPLHGTFDEFRKAGVGLATLATIQAEPTADADAPIFAE